VKNTRKNVLHPLGSIIKVRLIELNMTQKELAEQAGTSEKYLNLILYGHRAGLKYIPVFEKVLDISLDSYKKSA
jgi:transcriptional regulator with XRE-family HTH domain